MDFSSGDLQQLYIGLALGAGFFVVAFAKSEKAIMWILLLFIPFQPITTRFGSINEFLVLAIAGVFFVKGYMTRLPLSGAIGFIMFAYVLSLTQGRPGTTVPHLLYMLAIISNFALFWMVYNFVLREKGWETIFKILAVTNALVLGYCALQVVFGAERVMFFGISEWGFSTTATTGGEEISGRRVTGPFAATALTAEYFTIQIMIWAYFLIHVKEKRPRILLSVLIALNIGFLVATGNRGGFVSLVIGSLGYLFLFRKQLGLRRMVTISTRGIMLFAAMSIVVVTYTDFNSLYERLASTQFGRGFIPDSRQGWFYIWEFVVEKPFLGHGPRLAILGYQQITYPHNLFMYLFYTLGGVGLVAYAYFFVKIWRRYSRAKRYRVADKMLSGMPRLGLLILVIFLASQMRIELMRFVLHDYQQYFFMILAVFLAFSDMVRIRSLRSQPAPRRKRQVVLQTAMHDGS